MKKRKNKIRKILYSVIMLSALFLYSDTKVLAAISDYKFPDYISVNSEIYKAEWRTAVTKDGTTTYTNKTGAENVVENDLTALSEANINLNCVKFKTGVKVEKVNGQFVAKNEKNATEADYCTAGYTVSFSNTGQRGILSSNGSGGYTLKVCDYSSYNNKIKDLTDSNKISFNYNATTKKYTITFNGLDTNIFTMKNVRSTASKDSNGETIYTFDLSGNEASYDNSVIGSDGKSLILNPGTDFYVKFFIKESATGCEEASAAELQSGAPNYIPNYILDWSDANGNICQRIKRNYGTEDGVVKGMVPECFRTTVNINEEGLPTREEFIRRVADLDAMLTRINNGGTTQAEAVRKCNFVKQSNNIKTTTGTADGINAGNIYEVSISNKFLSSSLNYEYWRAECTEKMTVTYDDPKAVNAGGGFSYTTIITITRTCKPLQIKTPKKKPKCSYSADCMGGGHKGGPAAGPSEEFDSCINTCDGGKYSQSCIDTCYDQEYENTDAKTISYTDEKSMSLLTYESKNNGITKVAMKGSYTGGGNCNFIGKRVDGTPRPVSSCYILAGNGGCQGKSPDDVCPSCYTEHGVRVTYCDSCNGAGNDKWGTSGVRCYEVYNTTSECAINPEEDYYKQVIKARDEYQKLIPTMKSYIEDDYKDEIVETSVYDSYLDKQVTFGVNNQPITNVNITNSETPAEMRKMSNQTQTKKGYEVTEAMLTYTYQEFTTTRTQTVNLTQAYVSNTSNQTNGIGSIYTKNKLDCVRNDKNNEYCQKYYDGGYKYYTNLLTDTINDWRIWPYYNNANTDYSISSYTEKGDKYENIDVDLKNFGTWNQWSLNIDCIYGLWQNFNIPKDDFNNNEINKCDSSKDICSGGVQYIYREIHLDDEFPNDRDPRWNWTGTLSNRNENGQKLATGAARAAAVSYRGYNIDPYALTAHIEKNGYSIYDVKTDNSEVDYEFTLTGRNLKNIRQYNKSVEDFNGDGKKNYLDYDTSCYTKTIEGKQIEVCTNNFLDNEQYITYSTAGFTQNERKAIAGCNNAKNGQCYDVSASY